VVIRAALTVILALAVLVVPLVVEAQPAGKVYRIGLLSPTSQGLGVEAFREGLRALGYVEGHNVVVEHRSAQGRFDRLPELAAELVRLRVDVIVTVVTQASLAAKNATETIPIVMLAVGDPVGAGLVTSLAHPGGNVTGTSVQAVEVGGKSLELLKNAIPKLRVVAVLWNPANPIFQAQMVKETEAAARALGIQLRMLAARDAKEIDRAFAAMTGERAEALTVLVDPVFIAHLSRIAALAANSRLPSISGFREYAEAGGLMAYAANFSELGRRTALYVDKILKGAKPADLPVEQPTKFEFIINQKTAKALGLTIPQSLLLRADEVIQ
jgi:putative tryptophan/tyrosine transport system substrate-binding protein